MDNIKYVLENVERDTTAEYMSELLMDDTDSTYKMFEELASVYLSGDEKFREGMDIASSILTGWTVPTIAKNIRENMC